MVAFVEDLRVESKGQVQMASYSQHEQREDEEVLQDRHRFSAEGLEPLLVRHLLGQRRSVWVGDWWSGLVAVVLRLDWIPVEAEEPMLDHLEQWAEEVEERPVHEDFLGFEISMLSHPHRC